MRVGVRAGRSESSGESRRPRPGRLFGAPSAVSLAGIFVAYLTICLGSPCARGEPPAQPAPAGGSDPAVHALVDGAASPSQRAELAFLEHLGWRLHAGGADLAALAIEGGRPCESPDVAHAWGAGALRIVFPANPTQDAARAFLARLPEIVDSKASRAAWQLRMAPAVEKAARLLAESTRREDYTTPKILFVDSPFTSLEPPSGLWVEQKDVWTPIRSPGEAVAAFGTSKCAAEGFASQIIATWAMQEELYGAAGFDEAFKPPEVALCGVEAYPSTVVGHWMTAPEAGTWRALLVRPDESREDASMVLAKAGARAFAGLTGVLYDPKKKEGGKDFFTIVSVSDAAAASLRAHGGIGFVGRAAAEALALQVASRQRFVTGGELSDYRRKIDEIMGDPVFREIQLYSHPHGIVPLGELVERKRKRDRAALEMTLHVGGREDFFYRRYHEAFVAHAAKVGPTASARSGR